MPSGIKRGARNTLATIMQEPTMNAKRWISMVSLMAIFVGHLLLVHSVLADSAYL